MTKSGYVDQWDHSRNATPEIVFAIDPTTKGMGYIVFQSADEPLDWGATDIRVSKNIRTLHKVKKLCNIYQPDILIIDKSQSRSPRIRDFVQMIERYANTHDMDYRAYDAEQVKEVFINFSARTKYQRSEKIAQWLPELAPRLPSKRKNYESERHYQATFDAAALALTYFYLEN